MKELQCPKCLGEVPQKARKCKHCGSKLPRHLSKSTVVLGFVLLGIWIVVQFVNSFSDGTPSKQARNTPTAPQAVVVDHSVLSDTVQADSPLKTQVEFVVLVPQTVTESQLRTLLNQLYKQVSNRKGYKHHSRPTHIGIYAYTSEEKWKAGWGQWVGMVLRIGSDGEVKMEVNLANAQ